MAQKKEQIPVMQNAKEISGLHFTMEHTGKMRGMYSISTSCKLNQRCARNAEVKGSICEKCYAQRMASMYKNMEAPLANNFKILTKEIVPMEKLPFINACYFRIESFGDLSTVIQARNYIRLIKKNPHVFFGWWTKNPDLLKKAIEIEGKPENVKIIRSSMFVNKPQKPGYDFVDAVFTVYDEDTIKAKEININCGARSCLTCGKCYRKGGDVYINEKLK